MASICRRSIIESIEDLTVRLKEFEHIISDSSGTSRCQIREIGNLFGDQIYRYHYWGKDYICYSCGTTIILKPSGELFELSDDEITGYITYMLRSSTEHVDSSLFREAIDLYTSNGNCGRGLRLDDGGFLEKSFHWNIYLGS